MCRTFLWAEGMWCVRLLIQERIWGFAEMAVSQKQSLQQLRLGKEGWGLQPAQVEELLSRGG